MSNSPAWALMGGACRRSSIFPNKYYFNTVHDDGVFKSALKISSTCSTNSYLQSSSIFKRPCAQCVPELAFLGTSLAIGDRRHHTLFSESHFRLLLSLHFNHPPVSTTPDPSFSSIQFHQTSTLFNVYFTKFLDLHSNVSAPRCLVTHFIPGQHTAFTCRYTQSFISSI